MNGLVLATGNPGKRREMEALLAPLGLRIMLPSELGFAFDPEETGDTFLENARIKARAALALTGLPSLADDSGLEVDALGGAPGVHTARYGGPGLTQEERNARLLREMEPEENRAARFVCALYCVFPGGRALTARGVCDGVILRAPRGTGGFGYDPIFYLPDRGLGMAELSDEEKNAVSHRGRAAAELIRRWKEE